MKNDEPDKTTAQQTDSSWLFERNLKKGIEALKTLSERPEYKNTVLRDAMAKCGVDMPLYDREPEKALRAAIQLKYSDNRMDDTVQLFLSAIAKELGSMVPRIDPTKATSMLHPPNRLNPIAYYHRVTSSSYPQWVQDIDIDRIGLLDEVSKKYSNMQDMKAVKCYSFCGVTILGTICADYLIYNMANISPIVKAASILISTALSGTLISYTNECAQYKKASYTEMLRSCEHLFEGKYKCPPLDNANVR